MARYTLLLGELMYNSGSRERLDEALSHYPLYEAKNLVDLIPKREELNEKLMNHYKYREIGFETFGRFLDELKITMNEIMPRYNELFKTVEIMAELPSPFDNVDVTETFRQTTENASSSEGSSSQNDTTEQSGSSTQTTEAQSDGAGESSSSLNNTSNSKRLESDTPQGETSVGTKNISGVSYASKAEWNEAISEGSETSSRTETNRSDSTSTGSSSSNSSTTSTGNTSGSSESSSVVEHTFTKKGNQGVNTYAHDMNEFRTSIIDVVEQIINDERINELFMLVY